MKKIISIIAMFILSLGIVSAQTTPTFSYQSVVVDNNGDLVVETTVNANVIVTYAGGSYTETHTVKTSPNGMVVLPIGAGTVVGSTTFSQIDWGTASITVSYNATDRTIPTSSTTPVEPVPYALQADGFELNTPAITKYLSSSNTDIQDVYEIMDAVVNNPNGLEDDLKQAAIDYIIDNRLIAKDIMLYYIENAEVADVQALYNALVDNHEAKRVVRNVIVDYIKEHRELVIDVLMSYLSTMTAEEVNTIFASIPADVKTAVANYGLNYTKNHKASVVYPILMEYVSTITTSEFAATIQALESNTAAFQLVWNQFNQWMDEYFTQGGADNHVESIIEEEIANRHWVENCPDVDICQLKEDVEELENAAPSEIATDCPYFLNQDLQLSYSNDRISGSVEFYGDGQISGHYYIEHSNGSQEDVQDIDVEVNDQVASFSFNPGTLEVGDTVVVDLELEYTGCNTQDMYASGEFSFEP